jgi:hypothetical protein
VDKLCLSASSPGRHLSPLVTQLEHLPIRATGAVQSGALAEIGSGDSFLPC